MYNIIEEKSMQVYKYEKKDKLTDIVQANTSIAYVAKVKTSIKDGSNLETVAALWDNENIKCQLAKADANPDQIDLHYLDCVLVSTGWNKNTDVFGLQNTWDARNTPVDKKFDYMHDESDIIGHITSCITVLKNGSIYKEENVPISDFDIIIGTVLYKYWKAEERQKRIDAIIAEIEEDKWFVSMECLFADFDYAVISPEGENFIIARNDDTSFLTKHLVQYGGTGEYKEYKLGRYLKNLTFSGNGLVDNPANPASIIFNNVNPFQSQAILNQWEINMSDENKAVERLEKELADAKQEIVRLAKEAQESAEAKFKETVATAKSEVESLKKELEAAKAEVQTKDEKISELDKDVQAVQSELDKSNAEIEKIKAEAVKAGRLQKLADANVGKEKADELVAKFENISDDAFDELVLAYAKRQPKKEDEDEDEEEDAEGSRADDESDENENNADANVEDVESNDAGIGTVGSSGDDDENKVKEVRASAEAFIRKSMTKLGKKNKGEE